jgi:hypothetical protein
MELLKLPTITATLDDDGVYQAYDETVSYVTIDDLRAITNVLVVNKDSEEILYPMFHFGYTEIIVDMEIDEVQDLFLKGNNG